MYSRGDLICMIKKDSNSCLPSIDLIKGAKMEQNCAVLLRDAHKWYGKKQILDGLSMRVAPGTIYGLLGASGCGKTTLLSCIVGRKKLDGGKLWVMGGQPGTKESGIPGPNVGYMPQDISLVAEFTIKDTVYYFGRLLNMTDKKIEDRHETLSRLLDLPPSDRMIKHCSGGQQRRVSFAVAMIHEPKLLILDEPTVGLDPLLRDSIWNYLVGLARNCNTAVVITTHYIEEARQANTIGLMRKGKLLAEESPQQLLNMFSTDSLEEVFLTLSQKQENHQFMNFKHLIDDKRSNSIDSLAISETDHGSTTKLSPNGDMPKEKRRKTTSFGLLNLRRISALLHKNWKQFSRNYAAVATMLIFPIIQLLSFYLAIGDDVKDIDLAVVNDEFYNKNCLNYTRNGTVMLTDEEECKLYQLSCRFLNSLGPPMLNLIDYESLSTAMEHVRKGKVHGVLYVPSNFSEALEQRTLGGLWDVDESFGFGQIKVWLDMSNRQIGTSVKYELLKDFLDFLKEVVKECHYPEKFGSLPMHFYDPIYGKKDDIFTVFMVPGMLLTVIFFMGTLLTSTIIISDRLEGVWDRSIVAGVSSLEIIISHFMLQTCLVFVQTMEALVLTFAIYKIDYVGSMFTIGLISFLAGISGMSFGFWVSVVSTSHSMANILTNGLFYPVILLCGLMWPLEGMPDFLRFFARCLPFTIAVESLRNVISKGWSLNDFSVINGIGVMLLWVLCLGIISTVQIKKNR